jgi:hypothetical protein
MSGGDARRSPRRVRGVFERPKGSRVSWIRYTDENGCLHREKMVPRVSLARPTPSARRSSTTSARRRRPKETARLARAAALTSRRSSTTASRPPSTTLAPAQRPRRHPPAPRRPAPRRHRARLQLRTPTKPDAAAFAPQTLYASSTQVPAACVHRWLSRTIATSSVRSSAEAAALWAADSTASVLRAPSATSSWPWNKRGQ